jgi:GTP-binding protein HflX
VAVDHDLTPTQARNLERATGVTVMDRSAVILEIFHRHARSREARLQVEIARLNYVAPRLREGGGGGDRQRGGIGGKGAGESALELDRRRIRDRVAELKRELEAIAHEQDVRRARRQEQLRVALVGYTNAGKSSLMRALTGSEVYVADKLFATLDTTVRTLHPPTAPKVLVSDTVGFIKKLPHDLVASFRSTLDEAREATLLMHVVDGSDPAWPSHYEVTRAVLAEIDAGDIDRLLVINKVDRISEGDRAVLLAQHPDAVLLSAKDPADVARLREVILARMEAQMEEATVRVPFGRERVLPTIHESCRVLEEDWDEEGGRFRVKALPEALARLQAALGEGKKGG